jgi:hypothetical protein
LRHTLAVAEEASPKLKQATGVLTCFAVMGKGDKRGIAQRADGEFIADKNI